MTFWLRATATGTVEKSRLETALHKAVGRQPLLSARISGDPTDRTDQLSWELGVTTLPFVHFGHEGEPFPFPGDQVGIDLRREQALRVFVRQHAKHVVLSFQFHHAAIDAVAAARFLGDVLSYYDDQATLDTRLTPQHSEQIVTRGSFQLTPAQRRRRALKDLARALLFFRKFPKELVTRRGTKAFDDERYPAAVTRLLPPNELMALKNGAGKSRATVNDVMLRDLFLTVDDWNRAHGKREPVRLAMAINMRRGTDDKIPAANVVSMCFLDRTPSEFEDPTRLLRGIVRETTHIKAHFLGHALILVARLFGKVKGGMRWLMTPRLAWRCSATAVLSNLGEPLKGSRLPSNARGEILAGDLTLTHVELLSPVRPGTALAVGVVTYAGSTSLTFHYDHTRIDAAEAEALAGSFHGRLKTSMIAPEPGDTLLERLVAEHTAYRKGATAFYGLPIGKRVKPDALSVEAAGEQRPP